MVRPFNSGIIKLNLYITNRQGNCHAMETLITIFNTSCCFFTASYIAKTYLHQSYKPRKVDFPVLMLLVLACTFLPHPNGIFLWAFSNLVYLLYICHLDHKDSLPNRFLFFCLVHSTMLLIEGIFLFLCSCCSGWFICRTYCPLPCSICY